MVDGRIPTGATSEIKDGIDYSDGALQCLIPNTLFGSEQGTSAGRGEA